MKSRFTTTTKLPSTENEVKKLTSDWFKCLGGFSVAITSNGRGVAGISDRIGVIPVEITPAMVGMTLGVMCATEVKKPGRRGEKLAGATPAQRDFLIEVIAHHGIGALVDCEIDLHRIRKIIENTRQGDAMLTPLMQQLHERLNNND